MRRSVTYRPVPNPFWAEATSIILKRDLFPSTLSQKGKGLSQRVCVCVRASVSTQLMACQHKVQSLAGNWHGPMTDRDHYVARTCVCLFVYNRTPLHLPLDIFLSLPWKIFLFFWTRVDVMHTHHCDGCGSPPFSRVWLLQIGQASFAHRHGNGPSSFSTSDTSFIYNLMLLYIFSCMSTQNILISLYEPGELIYAAQCGSCSNNFLALWLLPLHFYHFFFTAVSFTFIYSRLFSPPPTTTTTVLRATWSLAPSLPQPTLLFPISTQGLMNAWPPIDRDGWWMMAGRWVMGCRQRCQ